MLIITCALKNELPITWLKTTNIPVLTLKSLHSGYWSSLTPKPNLVVIITGVGRQASKDSAQWICKQLTPSFVLNIGSAGSNSHPIGSWHKIGSLLSPSHIAIDSRCPIPLPEDWHIQEGTPLISNETSKYSAQPYLCDMEAYEQALLFKSYDIPFHSLKRVSDRIGKLDHKAYNAQLHYQRQELQDWLSQTLAQKKASISVIIPVYNREKRIKKAVESVLNQTLPPQEILVIDDGSSDEAGLSPYPITYIKTPHRGVSSARNTGISICKGDWIAFLDSDDTWHPTKLEEQWTYIQHHPYFWMVQSEDIWIRNDQQINPKKYHKKPCGWAWKDSLKRCIISPSGILIKKAITNNWFNPQLPACEDYDLWIRLTRDFPIGLINKPGITKYGGHTDQLSQKYVAMDEFRVLSLYNHWLKERLLPFKNQIKNELCHKIQILITGHTKHGHIKQCKALNQLTKYIESPFKEETVNLNTCFIHSNTINTLKGTIKEVFSPCQKQQV